MGRSISITQESEKSSESQEENQSDGSRRLGQNFSKARERADLLSSLVVAALWLLIILEVYSVLFRVAKMLERAGTHVGHA